MSIAIIAMFAVASVRAQTAPQPFAAPPTQTPSPTDAFGAAVAARATFLVPDGTIVGLEVLDTLNSAQRRRGDKFRLRVTAPIIINGGEVIPAGTIGVGEVIHVAAARGGGAPGELLIAARVLDVGDQAVALRGLKLGVTGGDNSGMALGVSLAAGPFAMFIRGHEIEIPAGTRVEAKIAHAVTLPIPAPEAVSNPQPIPPE